MGLSFEASLSNMRPSLKGGEVTEFEFEKWKEEMCFVALGSSS